MGKLGDRWTEIKVENVYGNNTLEEALNDRKIHLNEFMKILAGIISQKEECPTIGILTDSETFFIYNRLLVRSRASLMESQVSKVSNIAYTRPFLYIFPVLTVLLGIIAGPK